MLRLRAIEGYFGDPRWGGNAGRAGWAMLGYEGPRLVWSAYDQRPRVAALIVSDVLMRIRAWIGRGRSI